MYPCISMASGSEKSDDDEDVQIVDSLSSSLQATYGSEDEEEDEEEDEDAIYPVRELPTHQTDNSHIEKKEEVEDDGEGNLLMMIILTIKP